MTGIWRDGALVVSGLILGVAAGAGVVLGMEKSRMRDGQEVVLAVADPGERPPARALAPSATLASASSQCPAWPLIPVAGPDDGLFDMQSDLSGNRPADIRGFSAIASRAAKSGRLRDAEVALTMACRVATRFKGPQSVETANAQYQLAAHYVAASRTPGPMLDNVGAQLLSRAERLFTESHAVYRVRHGRKDAKTRAAAAGIENAQRKLLALAGSPKVATPPQGTSDAIVAAAMAPRAASRTAAGTQRPAPRERTITSPRPVFEQGYGLASRMRGEDDS